ncbi:MAG TPA: hypothetical protein VGF77_06985 [Allosphingosinicella sp.]|jgi:hypothetical protein
MWLDAGIGSRIIIAAERTPLSGGESLGEIHIKVMDLAHELCCRCVARLREGAALPSIPEAANGKGRLFLAKHWPPNAMLRAVRTFHFRRIGPVSYRPSNRLVAPDQP